MTKLIINPKSLKIKIHFDNNDWMENIRLLCTLNAQPFTHYGPNFVENFIAGSNRCRN